MNDDQSDLAMQWPLKVAATSAGNQFTKKI
jgi:hypothetical protein